MGTSALPDTYARGPRAEGRHIRQSTSAHVITNNVTLSYLRSKDITGIHKPCISHSNDSSATTEYKLICIQM